MKHLTFTKFSKVKTLTQNDLDFLNEQIAKHSDEKQLLVSISLEKPQAINTNSKTTSDPATTEQTQKITDCKGTKGPCPAGVDGFEYNCNGYTYCIHN